jgi:hypothetical protein
MATLSELVDMVAQVEGLDASTVGLIARNLREAGHIVTGGRGLSAAKMRIQDAANLLIAVNASSIVREAAAQVVLYRDLVARELVWPKETRRPKVYGTFGEALELIIECALQKKLPETFLSQRVDDNLSSAFARGHAAISITFEKPSPSSHVHIAPQSGVTGTRSAAVDQSPAPELARTLSSFSRQLSFHFGEHRSRGSLVSRTDRQEQTTIGSKTIYAVAQVLR